MLSIDNRFSADSIYGSVDTENRPAVFDWSVQCLLEQNMGDARAGFRAIAAYQQPVEHNSLHKNGLENVEMTVMERETYLHYGYLREALATQGILNGYTDKYEMRRFEIDEAEFIACGDVCLERGDLQNALDSYLLAKSKQKLCELYWHCKDHGENEWAVTVLLAMGLQKTDTQPLPKN